MANATNPLATRHFTASATESFKSKLSPPHNENTSALAAASATPPAPIDILLTNEWPTEITHQASKEPANYDSTWGVPAITEIASHAQPKYMFCSNAQHPCFWEREPFRWPTVKHVTRFISLGQLGNQDKTRWFYAFSLPAVSAPPAAAPPNTTACPFDHVLQGAGAPSRGKKRAFGIDEGDQSIPDYIFGGAGHGGADGKGGKKQPPQNYVCRLCQQPGHYIQDCEMAGESQPKKAKVPPKEITREWFAIVLCEVIELTFYMIQRVNAGSAFRIRKSASTCSSRLATNATWLCRRANCQMSKKAR